GQLGVLLDAIERHLAGAAEDREHSLLATEIDGVVAPFPGGHLAAVQVQNLVEFQSREESGGGVSGRCVRSVGMRARAIARAELYCLGFAQWRLLLSRACNNSPIPAQFQAPTCAAEFRERWLGNP